MLDTEHLIAAWAAPIAPSGAAIRQWIAKHPDIKGVGHSYAERLWDAFGRGLYDVLRERDVDAISKVLDYQKAAAIVDAFGLLVDEISALEDLDDFGLDGRHRKSGHHTFWLGFRTPISRKSIPADFIGAVDKGRHSRLVDRCSTGRRAQVTGRC